MGGMKINLVMVVVVMAALAGVAAGQSVAEQYLSAHNNARRAVGAGIPDLKWSTQLQAYANNWASDRANKARCALSHSGGPYGENIYWSSGSSTPAAAVTAWVNEKQFYNYASNSCAAGKVCGHYTQVVWRNSQSVGCGSATCPGGGKFVVCSYYPPGNYNGQKPYLQSKTTPAVEGGLEEA
ncbi:hypothetical protein M758_2G014700 [Ceratodon purpureus]|uniref:SCP domain-containing protein n=1 Tax=Ceratodon purpureus TaxID=3225 RepID=A0A8T0IQM2_CERPU|nr:hypothetical protein KC19_2G015100 [Ceratodon purpureus]KAG0624926.1 hypothetical protein M758_2G014700 [Ceratodon purpureus]